MELQTTLEDEPIEYETILDEEDMTEMNENNGFEPSDLADQAYEAWRDEKRSKEAEYNDRGREMDLLGIERRRH